MTTFQTFTKDTHAFLPWKLGMEALRDGITATRSVSYANGAALPSPVANAFAGAIPAPGVQTVLIPHAYDSVGIVELNGTLSLISVGLTSSTKCAGACYHKGKVYFAPYAGNFPVLILNLATRTLAQGPVLTTLTGGYTSACVRYDGRIVFTPFNGPDIVILNPNDLSVERVAFTGITGTNKWWGSTPMPNGDIVFAPVSGDMTPAVKYGILKAGNPAVFEAGPTLVTTTPGSSFNGIIPMLDGNALSVPRNARSWWVYKSREKAILETYSFVFSSLSLRHRGGTLAPDGTAVMAPLAAPTFSLFNSQSYGYTVGPASPGANAFGGCAPNHLGKIICAPSDHGYVGVLTMFNADVPFPDNLRCSPFLARC